MQALLNDEAFKKAIQEKDVAKALSHPGFVGLTQDPEFQRVMSAFKRKPDAGKN